MGYLLPSNRFREEFSEITRIDITNIICFFILSFICAYVFLEMAYMKFFKDSTLKISIAGFMNGFRQKQSIQLAG
tara:strand:- start:14617 stop:14841 length:225 start_codon:yes stop_codon:yes gene_type:complete